MWKHDDENLPEWDGRFDEDFNEDTKENGEVYKFSDDEATGDVDIDLLWITVQNGKDVLK